MNFNSYTLDDAPVEAQPVLQSIQDNYGFIPNLFAYMAEAPTTIEAYLALNELVSKTSFSPAQQQIALLTVSVENQCDFCTVAHQAFGKLNKVDQQTLTAISNNTHIEDEKDRMLVHFTQKLVQNRGRLEAVEIDNFIQLGFTRQQILEVILIISIKTLSNYINHLTSPEPNKELLSMI